MEKSKVRICFLLIVACSLSCPTFAQDVGDTIIVVKDDAQLKQQTGNVATIPRGNHLQVEVVNGNWFWVIWNGNKGWIHKRDIIPVSQGVDYFTQALERSPNAGDYNNRALVWEFRGDLDKAMTDYNKSIRLDPKYPSAYNNRGMIWAQQGKYDQAIADFDQAIKLDAKYVDAYYNRSNAYYAAGEFESAVADYTKILELDPKDVEAQNALAWLLATCADPHFRDGKRAVQLATQACEFVGWKQAGYLDTLAAAYAETGDFENAIKWQQQALRLAPADQKERFQSRLTVYQEGKPFHEE